MLHSLLEFGDILEENENNKISTITFQITENCNLNCTYCYQQNKTMNTMPFSVAKTFIDNLFLNAKNKDAYFSIYNTKGLIIEFIGGEPLLEIDLIIQIVEYFEDKFNNFYPELDWTFYHTYLITTNGLLYNTPKFQSFLNQYGHLVSITVTLDGCKQAHDKCRISKTGQPSFNIALEAALLNKEKFNNNVTKITLSPDNIEFLYESITSLISYGFSHILATFTFEEGWTSNHAQICFNELTKVNNWLIENNMLDFCYISLLDIKNTTSSICDKNWCGFNSSMLAIDYQGNLYPCIRFMETSLNNDQPPYIIGNIYDGIGSNSIEKERINSFKQLDYKNQSEQKCLNCFCSGKCAWCSAYNYQYYGTIFKRTTFHCEMQEACAAAIYDLYNKLNISNINIPQSIIDKFFKKI